MSETNLYDVKTRLELCQNILARKIVMTAHSQKSTQSAVSVFPRLAAVLPEVKLDLTRV